MSAGVIALDLSALLLDTLGYQPDEFVSLLYENGAGPRTAVKAPADAVAAIGRIPADANVFFGVNPIRGPARNNAGRGKTEDVTRLAALWADLDVKADACKDLSVAQAIIDELSKMLGTRPSSITHSGNGLHPYWPVSDGHVSATNAAALVRRWGRLVAVVAEAHGARVDSVYDLPRMLRVPGTFNNKAAAKGDAATPVTTYADTGGPLTVVEIDERFNEYGIYQEDHDTRSDEQISEPDGWRFSSKTCNYVTELIDGISTDGPKPGKSRHMGRHQWACKQAVRLACAHMLGCISESDWGRAQKLLGKRLSNLRAATGETVPQLEIPGVFKLGIERASAKTEDQARAELGDHDHDHENTAGHLSDARISELMVDRILRGNYCWSNGLGWMRWDGSKWSATTTEDVVEQSRRFAKLLLADAVRSGADLDTIRANTRRLTAGAVRAAADLAKGQLLVDARAFDAHPDLLNVANGVIDLRTGKLGDHDPDLLLTKCAPTNYEPDAVHRDWHDALSALPAEVNEWMQTRLGQAITGHPTPDDVLPVLHGAGANGKTTLTTAIACALGEHATIVPDRVLLSSPGDHPTELMTLRGARLALLEETPEARYLNVKRLKDVLGTPQMTARLIRRDSVAWTATHSLFVSTNYRPRVEETDHGTWRRLALVTFPYTYRKPGTELNGPNDRHGDPTLRDRLKTGCGGRHEAVLAWLVAGARRWYKNEQVMPAPPATVTDDTRVWRHGSDLILRWFDEVLIVDSDFYTPGLDLYDAFLGWLNANGHQKWTSQTFADRFGQHDEVAGRGIVHTRVRFSATDLLPSRFSRPFLPQKLLPERFRAWVGVRFRTESDPAEGP